MTVTLEKLRIVDKIPVISKGYKKIIDESDFKIYYPFLLIHLKILSLSGLTIKKVFKILGESREIIGGYAKLFKRLDLLVNKWGYKTTKALEYIADKIRNKDVRNLLYRLSYSQSLGISLRDFLNIEYYKYLLDEDREIAQKMDRLRIYSEAYSAILNSNIMISVVALMIGVTFGTLKPINLLTSILVLMAMTIFAILMLFKITVPRRGYVLHRDRPIPMKLKNLLIISRPTLIITTVMVIFPNLMAIYLLSGLPYTEQQLSVLVGYILPLTYGVAGFTLLIVGYLGRRRVDEVIKLDQIYMIFIKTLGEATTIGGSLLEGLKRIRYNDFKDLNPYLNRLYTRIRLGIDPEIAFKVFSRETGSNIISRYNGVYIEGLKAGSPATDIADIINDAVNREIILRGKRTSVTNYLKGMLLPLQGVFTAIFTLVASLMTIFYKLSNIIAGFTAVRIISIPNPIIVIVFIFLGSVILTYGNSLALYILKGDSIFTLLYYLGMLLLISSLTYIGLSFGLSWLFNMFMSFQKGVNIFG